MKGNKVVQSNLVEGESVNKKDDFYKAKWHGNRNDFNNYQHNLFKKSADLHYENQFNK